MISKDIKNYINSSSLGVYMKYIILINNEKYLVKSGRGENEGDSSSLEPVTECICYELAKLMGIPSAEYYLEEKEGVLLSLSKWFYNDEEEEFYSANRLMRILKISKENLYYKLIKEFPKLEIDINNMIVFDYIINNTDRHLKNFGFIQRDEEIRFAPLYDNGLALGSHIDEEELQNEDLEDLLIDSDYSKCFDTTNRKQLKLVKSHGLNLDINIEDIINKYSKYFSKKRIQFIISLLNSRIKEVKECYQNQQ